MKRDLRTNPFQVYPRVLAKLPRIVRLYIFHCVIGFALSGVFTAAVLYTNVANIGHLVSTVEGGMLAAVVFFVLNGIVFASVQTAIVIMSLGDTDDSGGGGLKIHSASLQPAPVRKAHSVK